MSERRFVHENEEDEYERRRWVWLDLYKRWEKKLWIMDLTFLNLGFLD